MRNLQHHYFENQYYISFHQPFSSYFVLFYFKNEYKLIFLDGDLNSNSSSKEDRY